MIRFDGQVALVTGAGRGLGRAYALLLAERGAHVVVHDAGVDVEGGGHDESVARSVMAEIVQAGGQAMPAFDDLAVRGSGRSLVERVMGHAGRLDVLIHSAGIAPRGELAATTDEMLDRAIAVNGRSAIELTQAAVPIMSRQRYGRIVLTVSGHGLYPGDRADLVAYSIGKAMQFGLMSAVAGVAARSGVLVNAISPVAATRMMSRRVDPGIFRAEDVAPGVAFLASDRCQSFGLVLRAADGAFSIGQYAVTAGLELTPADQLTPEAVAGAWAAITAGPLDVPGR